MWMNSSEIARSYRMAKDKRHQLTILAELNLCSVAEIKSVLINMGEIEEKPHKASEGEHLNTQNNESENIKEIKKPSKVHKTKAKDEVEKTKKIGGIDMKKIPESIAKIAFDKLDEIERQIKALEAEYKEIAEFLEVASNE